LYALGLEILKRRAAVERWNLGALFEPFGAAFGEAGATFGATYAGAFDDNPAGAAALFANRLRGHYSYYRADADTGRMGFVGRPKPAPRRTGRQDADRTTGKYTPQTGTDTKFPAHCRASLKMSPCL